MLVFSIAFLELVVPIVLCNNKISQDHKTGFCVAIGVVALLVVVLGWLFK